MKKLLVLVLALSSLSIFASECSVRIEREGIAAADIKYKNEVITKKGQEFGFIRNYSEELGLEECIDFAKKEANWITNHESVTSGISKVVVRHELLTEGPYTFEVKAQL